MSFRDRIAQWDIIRRSKLWFSISLTIIAIGVASMIFNQVKTGFPINLGIDFQGGSVITLTFTNAPDTSKIDKIFTDAGYKNAKIMLGTGNNVTIKLAGTIVQAKDVQPIIDNIAKEVAPIETDQTGVTSIAPVIGAQLERTGAIALGLALLFVLFYITIRFAFKYALATVLALFHDILITLGMLSLFRVELNAPFIGAFLAIITYSVEDTVVVIDRIRESLRFRSKETFKELVTRSINEVWVRSMNTSLTTLFASLSLVVFGGPNLRDFSMTLMFGLFSGTYSSIYIASPLLVLWQKDTRPSKSVISIAEKKPSIKVEQDNEIEEGVPEQAPKAEPKNVPMCKSFLKR
jgi:preprotein translocase subunit SecF